MVEFINTVKVLKSYLSLNINKKSSFEEYIDEYLMYDNGELYLDEFR